MNTQRNGFKGTRMTAQELIDLAKSKGYSVGRHNGHYFYGYYRVDRWVEPHCNWESEIRTGLEQKITC